jgi:hypothetical protein
MSVPILEQPSLTRLPLELLTAIVNEFDVFVTDESDPESSPGCQPIPKALHPDIAALRSVCRLFRTIVYAMRFWYVEDVDITALLPSTCSRMTDDGEYVGQCDVNELMDHLSDQLFVRAIEKRIKWRFKQFPLLLAILERVPLFRRNVTSVVLDFLKHYDDDQHLYTGDAMTASIAILGYCPNITSLDIIHVREPLRLSLLAIACPALKSLRIMHINAEEFYWGSVQGDLEGLTSLEEFEIRDFYLHIDEYSFLPVSSAASLTRLSFLSHWRFTSGTNLDVLDIFVNLKSLSFSPLTLEMVKWITRTKTDLLDLRFYLVERHGFDESWPEFDELMSSKSLRNLRECRFSVSGIFITDERWLQLTNAILRAIIKHQTFLEKLVLTAVSDDDSVALLPQLGHLKTISWHDVDVDSETQVSASEVKQRINAAFKLSPAKPVTEVFPHYDFRLYPHFELLVD